MCRSTTGWLRLQPTTTQALTFWKDSYMTRWVTLNSVRTLACFVASGFTLGGAGDPLAIAAQSTGGISRPSP
jgi:hypothetical protein